MKQTLKSNVVATGFAMFSMFFGAGNIVFPLALGQYAKDMNIFAIMGLLITAVGVPFTGLIAMTLFNGDYKQFFSRIGKVPGFLVAVAIMGLIGPFGALPRCITLAYATVEAYLPGLSLPWFSAISCVLIFLLTFKKNTIVEILGYVLTPLLLGSLAIIIIKGILVSPSAPVSEHNGLSIFLKGITEGYQTMDLLGAFFFSSVILACLEQDVKEQQDKRQYYRDMMKLALKSTAIGATLLALTYIGFSFTAAFNSDSLADVKKDVLLSHVSILILGPYAGIVAGIAAAMACLTTAIALAAVFSEFIHNDITQNRIGYIPSLIVTLLLSFFVSTLEFSGIASFLLPILQISYPALIVLSVLNIFYRLYHFKPVIIPVAITFLLSLIAYFL